MIDNVTPDEAKKALESVVKMEGAGWRRAVPGRWFSAGVAVLIGGMFALYALEDPYPYIVFPIIGLPLFIISAREKSGAYGRDAPASTANVWAIVLFIIVLLIVFFGSIFIRRAYDAEWVSLVAGVLVGLVVFLTNESARRVHLAKVNQAENK
jgi:xanthine/uracil permease